MTFYQPMRPNGGQFIHAVDLDTGRAVCGHRPKDTARKMRPRGGWRAPWNNYDRVMLCHRCMGEFIEREEGGGRCGEKSKGTGFKMMCKRPGDVPGMIEAGKSWNQIAEHIGMPLVSTRRFFGTEVGV